MRSGWPDWVSPVNVVCGALLLAALALFSAQGLFEDGGLETVHDHAITHSLSRQVAETHVYFRDFTYPLPAVIFKLALGSLGLGLSSVLWSLGSIAAAAAVIAAVLRLLGEPTQESRSRVLLAPTLAFGTLVWCVQWDYRAVNVNMVVLALALWGLLLARAERPVPAGALLAASIALKLYSLPLLAVLAVRRWWAALAWTGVWCAALFVVLPLLYFGPSDAAKLSGLWLGTVWGAMQPGFVLDVIAYKISFEYVLLVFLSGVPGQEALARAAWPEAAVRGLMRGVQGIVACVVAWQLAGSWRRPVRAAEGRRLLVDGGAVLALMLLLSPLVEPHHGVLALVPAMLLAHSATDRSRSTRANAEAGGVLLLVFALLSLAPSGAWRGLAFNASLIALLVASVFMERPDASGPSAAPPAETASA